MEGSRSKFLASFVLVLGILPLLTAGQIQFGRCRSEPCQNGGECHTLFRLFYTCTCPDDYAGGNCQYERACSLYPCENGATCTDNPPDYENRVCTCPPNVFGDSCELIRECMDDDVRCGPYCFPAVARCDYNRDCPDGTDEEGCNEIDITPTGVNLTSPYFPRPGYIDDFDYTWYLTSPEDHYITLEFWTFDFEYYKDMVLIGEGLDNGYENAIYRLTGHYDVLRILPKSSNLWIRMVTDGDSSPNFGFKVYARAVPIDEAATFDCDPETEFSCKDGMCVAATVKCDGFSECTNEFDEYECPRTICDNGEYIPEYERCNQHWFCPNGEDEYFCEPAKLGDIFYVETPVDIYDPNSYEAYSNETWTLVTEAGLCFTVYFSYFKTEKGHDLWYVGYGGKVSTFNSYPLSGNFVIDPFIIPGDKMFAHFVSDGNKNEGYVLMEVEVVNKTELLYCEKGSFVHKRQTCDGEWQCLDGRDEAECEPLPRGEVRKVVSNYFPEGYSNNNYQVWTFTTEEDLKLMLQISVLQTEENYDVLAVSSGSSCTTENYANFSGTSYGEQFLLSQDNTMCIFFSSDYSVPNIGIYATVYAVAEEDYLICSSDGSVVANYLRCDFRWHCPDGEDEQGCDPLPLYTVVPITSPNFPSPYPPDSSIILAGSSEPGTEVYFEFDVFDFEEDVDFLIVGCGLDPTNESSIIANLTGNKVTSLFVPCSSSWFRLESDAFGSNVGYSGTAYIVPSSDSVVCPENGDTVSRENVCDGRWHCPLSGEDEMSCSRIPLNSTVLFASENYPAPYPANSYFIYSGSGDEGKSAYVEFYDFDLQEGRDFLAFGCGLNPFDRSTVVQNLTGSALVPPFTLECDSIWFTHVTDFDEGGNRGYYGSITTIERSGLTCSDGTIVPSYQICDGRWDCTLEGEDERDCPRIPLGVSTPFQSHNYPGPYPEDLFIIFYGRGEEGLSAVVEFIDFDLEDGQDFLTFGCGDNPFDQSSVVDTLTGGLPSPLTIDCDEIWFTFSTDSSAGNNRGYYGTITTIVPDDGILCSDGTAVPERLRCDGRWHCRAMGEDEQDCPRIPLGEAAIVESDDYPRPYSEDESIVYYGRADEGLAVMVEFIDFDLEDGQDFLTFGCGNNPFDQSSVVASFTGGLPSPLTINCDEVWFRFDTDSSKGNNRGFRFSIETIERQAVSGDLVAGGCQSYLPYPDAAPEALFDFRLPLERDVVRELIMGPACNDDEILRGICSALYPPKEDGENHNLGLCSATCEKFSRCASIDLLMQVDCDIVEREQPFNGFPGLCQDAEDE